MDTGRRLTVQLEGGGWEVVDLFSNSLEDRFDEYAPLSARMRPRDLDEVVGQQHILGPSTPSSH